MSYRECTRRGDVRHHEFSDRESFQYGPPTFANHLPTEISDIQGGQSCRRPFVLEVPEVVVSTNQGLLIPEEGTYLKYDYWRESETVDEVGRKDAIVARDLVLGIRRGNVPNLMAKVAGDVPDIPTCVSLLGTHSSNYTHWTQECLTQLEGVEAYEQETGLSPRLLVPSEPPSFIPQSLEHLGFSSDQLLEWEHEQARAETLMLPSPRRCLNATGRGFVRSPSGLRWVRKRALANLSRGAGEGASTRIFISREDASTRRIRNRDEVEDYLASRGFEKRVLSPLTYREQVALFSRAEFVVGTHGAGMINSLYTMDAPILELYGDHYLPANYEVAQAIGATYGCLACEAKGHDIRVDLDELAEALNTLESQHEWNP